MPISVIAVRMPTLRARLPRSRARDDRCGSIRRTVDALPESELLVAARRGDPTAFERLVSRYRRELYAHSYRMLGSVQDAEDALQESLLGAWRAWLRSRVESSVCAWLYPITILATYAPQVLDARDWPIPMSFPRESRLHLIER
jgi:Sigma-70 region 2